MTVISYGGNVPWHSEPGSSREGSIGSTVVHAAGREAPTPRGRAPAREQAARQVPTHTAAPPAAHAAATATAPAARRATTTAAAG